MEENDKTKVHYKSYGVGPGAVQDLLLIERRNVSYAIASCPNNDSYFLLNGEQLAQMKSDVKNEDGFKEKVFLDSQLVSEILDTEPMHLGFNDRVADLVEYLSN